jgi:hypothetical protein
MTYDGPADTVTDYVADSGLLCSTAASSPSSRASSAAESTIRRDMTYDGPADIAVRREIRADFMTDSLVPLTIVRRSRCPRSGGPDRQHWCCAPYRASPPSLGHCYRLRR